MARARDPIDNYFTRSIVGESLYIEFGPEPGMQALPHKGTWVRVRRDDLKLIGVAARSLFQGDLARTEALMPASSARLRRLRRDLALAAVLVWSGALWLVFTWLHR